MFTMMTTLLDYRSLHKDHRSKENVMTKWTNRCVSGILIFLAVAIVSGCSVRGATHDADGIVIVDGKGELSKNESERHVDKMLEQTDSEALTSMVADISALSDAPLYKLSLIHI